MKFLSDILLCKGAGLILDNAGDQATFRIDSTKVALVTPTARDFVVSPENVEKFRVKNNSLGISLSTGIVPTANNTYDIGSSSFRFNNVYFNIGNFAGTLTASIAALGSAATVFLTHTSGLIQSRSVSQVLSDIGAIGGSGTSGFIPKFTGTSTLGNSSLQDDGIGTLTYTAASSINNAVFKLNTSAINNAALVDLYINSVRKFSLGIDTAGNFNISSYSGGTFNGKALYVPTGTYRVLLGDNSTDDGVNNLQVSGGVKITGTTLITASTASTSTTTGALIVTGGMGVGGAIFAVGTLSASISALGSTATTFLTHTAGLIQSRTVAQVLADIGAAASSGSTAYIQNQFASAQTSASAWIDGNFRVGTNTTLDGTLTVTGTQTFTGGTRMNGGVGVGSATSTAIAVTIESGVVTGTTTRGVNVGGTISATSTVGFQGFNFGAVTANTAVTYASVEAFKMNPAAVAGAASTITEFDGFYNIAGSVGSNVTTVYIFRSLLNSATNRWNLYLDGSARNYINGNLQVGSATATAGAEKLQVTGTASISSTLLVGGVATFSNNIITNGAYLQISSATNPSLYIGNTIVQWRIYNNNTTNHLVFNDALSDKLILEYNTGNLTVAGTITSTGLTGGSAGAFVVSNSGTLVTRTAAQVGTELVGVNTFINNQSASAQSASAWITGDVRLNGALRIGTSALDLYASSGSIRTSDNLRVDGILAVGGISNGNTIEAIGSNVDAIGIRAYNNNASGPVGNKYFAMQAMGSTASSIPGWANAGVLESANDGGIAYSAYSVTNGHNFQTGSSRISRLYISCVTGTTRIGQTMPSDNVSYDLIVGVNGILSNGALSVNSTSTLTGLVTMTGGFLANASSLISTTGDAYFTLNRASTSFKNALLLTTNGTSDWAIATNSNTSLGTSDFAIYSYGTSNYTINISKSTGLVTIANSLSVLTNISITGTATIGGGISSTMGNNALLFGAGSATTGFQYMRIINTSGNMRLGVEGSAGSELITGAPAYATVLGTASATSLVLGTNTTAALTINSSQNITLAGNLTVSGGTVTATTFTGNAATSTLAANSTLWNGHALDYTSTAVTPDYIGGWYSGTLKATNQIGLKAWTGYYTSGDNVSFGTGAFSNTVTMSMAATNNAAIVVDRSATSNNGIIKFTTATVDRWILGNRNTSDETFRLYNYALGADVFTVSDTTGNVSFASTTVSSSVGTGAIVVAGGIGVGLHSSFGSGITVLRNTATNAAGTFINSSSTGYGMFIQGGTTGGYYGLYIVNYNASTSLFGVDGGGTVTIYQLGTGAVQSTGGVLSVISDGRLKNSLGRYDNALQAINSLDNGHYYTWKQESGIPTNIKQFSLFADNVNQILGDVFAPKDEKGFYSLSDRALLSLTIQAVKEEDLKIETLTKRVNDQELEIDKLRNMLKMQN